MANSKLVSSRTYSGTFPSPETPPCGEDEAGIGVTKGWSSERVPRSSYHSRKHVASAAMMPFSSGRTLPSKWEDAERWICSPVNSGNAFSSNDNNNNSSSNNNNHCYYGTGSAGAGTASQLAQYQQRRAKSKSGPLGPIGPAYYGSGYNNFSPVLGVGVINGGRWRNSLAIESPSLASTRFEERLGIEGDGGGGSKGGRRSCPGHPSDATTRWLDSWSGPTSPAQQTQDDVNLRDENSNDINNKNLEQEFCNDEPGVDGTASRRDMATQMCPDSQSSDPSSAVSSPKSSISTTSPSPLLFNQVNRDVKSPAYEVRDVQIDKQASSTRSRPHANDGRLDDQSNSSTSIEAGDKISKIQREEARINAWENLQKAKAESAIQKLEEKLEKKRESQMNKIQQKLRRVEIKAHKMRSSVSSDSDQTESRAISKSSSKFPSFCKKIRLIKSSRSSCSTCYPF